MIATLIRQDAAFRRLPFWVLMAMVWAGVASGVIAWATVRGGPLDLDLLALIVWFSVALYLVFGEIGTRTSAFNLSLPISTRVLWLAHVVAVGLTAVTVLLISAGVTTAALLLTGKLVAGWHIESHQLGVLGAYLFAALVLAIGIVHAYRPDALEVPLSLRRAGWSLAAAVVPLLVAALLRPLGPAGAVLVLGVAAALLIYLFRAVPGALFVPIEARRAVAVDPAAEAVPLSWEATRRPPTLWLSMKIVHGVTTCAKKPVAMFFVIPFLVFLGFWVSGIDGRWMSNTQRFAYPLMIVYTMMAVTTMPLTGLGAVEWLPWSRRRTFALMTIPLLLAAAIGYGIGWVTNGILGEKQDELLCYVTDRASGEPRLCIVLGACEISWSGDVPEVAAPWGEAHVPWSKPVVKGLPIRMYFPYDVPPGSSADFAALQISRAAGVIYGADIPAADIRARYLEATDDGSAPTLSLQKDYPDLRRGSRGVYFPWIMAEVVVLWSLLTAGYAQWLRGGVSDKKRKVAAVFAIAVPMVLWVLDFVLEVTGLAEISVRNAFIMNLSRRAAETPLGVLIVWAASALIAWAAYRLVERRFERAELSLQPIAGRGCTW